MFAITSNRRGQSLFEKLKFSTAERGKAKSTIIRHETCHYQTLDNIEGFEVFPSSRETETFSYQLGKTNKRPFYSRYSSGLSNSAFVKTCPKLCTSDDSNEPRGSFANQEIQGMLRKGTIEKLHLSLDQFLSSIFVIPKDDTGNRPEINLKKLNKHIPYEHFKMESLLLLKEVLQKVNYMCKINFKRLTF